jgi:ankyrin repeat protein
MSAINMEVGRRDSISTYDNLLCAYLNSVPPEKIDMDQVEAILRDPSFDVNEADANGMTPMHYAVTYGLEKVVKRLLVYPKIILDKPMSFASFQGIRMIDFALILNRSIEVVKLLLNDPRVRVRDYLYKLLDEYNGSREEKTQIKIMLSMKQRNDISLKLLATNAIYAHKIDLTSSFLLPVELKDFIEAEMTVPEFVGEEE